MTSQLADRKLSTILQTLLLDLELTWILRDGVLWITSEDEAADFLKTCVYDVRDLCDSEVKTKALVEAIVATADDKLVGLGNAILDGHLVAPHLLVLPEYHGQCIGSEIMRLLLRHHADFHIHMLTADAEAISICKRCGFRRAGHTGPMWIYAGNDH